METFLLTINVRKPRKLGKANVNLSLIVGRMSMKFCGFD